MAMALSGVIDRTTEIVALGGLLEALEEPEFIVQIQSQRPMDLESAVRLADQMEAVMQTL